MHSEDKTLNLLQSYEFDVLVGENNNWFAGKLTLSPKIIVFRIVGEECGKRKFKDKWRNKEYLICKDINKTFVLFDLRVIAGPGLFNASQLMHSTDFSDHGMH